MAKNHSLQKRLGVAVPLGALYSKNNKIIGAVTHVLVDNVDHGYGIFIEWMLEESDNLRN